MVIRHSGKGFDGQLAGKGKGLTNMRQRAAQTKGKLAIESKPGEGTVITLAS